MQLVVGVDGGGTKTVAVVADLNAEILGVGYAGGSNWENSNEKQACQVIINSIQQSLQAAGAKMTDVCNIHLGLAGLDWPEDSKRLRNTLAKITSFAGPITMESDAFLGIRACSPTGKGVGVNAGTGVCAGIIPNQGEPYAYGSFIDYGGGIDIDAQILRAVIRSADGRGMPTSMSEQILETTEFKNVTELVYAISRRKYKTDSGLFRSILFKEADKGDFVARQIVGRFGDELALCAVNLINRYELAAKRPFLVGFGSLLTKTGSLLYSGFYNAVLKSIPDAKIICAAYPPVIGALRAGLRKNGEADTEIWKKLCGQVVHGQVNSRWVRSQFDES